MRGGLGAPNPHTLSRLCLGHPACLTSMNVSAALLFAAGATVYALTMWDTVKTTLSMHGGGPLTMAVTRGIDAAIARTGDKAPDAAPTWVARYSNLLLTVALFTTWFGGLLGAAFLLMTAGEAAGYVLTDGSWLDRVYNVGASLTRAGFAGLIPEGAYGKGLTFLVATSGLLVTSLGISYVVSLVSAVSAQRALAREITNLGRDPRDLLRLHFDGEGFGVLATTMGSIPNALITHTQRHLAYPAVHYVRADDDRDCLPAAVALLDETLTILLYEVPAEALPPHAPLLALRRAVTSYLESLHSGFALAVPPTPPWPEVSFLYSDFGILPEGRTRGLDAEAQARLERRRSLLRAAVASQGIEWARRWEHLQYPAEDRLDGDVAVLLQPPPNKRRQGSTHGSTATHTTKNVAMPRG